MQTGRDMRALAKGALDWRFTANAIDRVSARAERVRGVSNPRVMIATL